MSGPSSSLIDCPHCHEQCGWCSDYRWLHGKLLIPRTRKRCPVDGMNQDKCCPICGGTRKVIATTTYAKAREAP